MEKVFNFDLTHHLFVMAGINVGDRISIIGSRFKWFDPPRNPPAPKWCVEPGRTFEVIQIDKQKDGRYRVVIGNPCLNDGVVTKGVTGAIIINDKTIFK